MLLGSQDIRMSSVSLTGCSTNNIFFNSGDLKYVVAVVVGAEFFSVIPGGEKDSKNCL